ncbi:cell wall hydrolase [Gorillibacterium timonense]|uniref:cell wall hydrolase n=1 Tax=Gorillibacterium timonense TaxID=1689269 RepID=UPI00071D14D4|nr:cell wall hydrolase [Gorillibacterium timonense]
MSDANFGKSISYSSGWYNSLSDVEVLTRLLYGENTVNVSDQNAVAWVVINRKSNGSFGGSTYRGVATSSGAFEPITGGSSGTTNARVPDKSSARWSNAVWNACTLLSTSSASDYASLVSKPAGISSQLYFVGLTYFLLPGNGADTSPAGSGLRYSFNGGSSYVAIKDVVIVFDSTSSLQNPSSIATITSNSNLDTNSERSTHNIFYNLK